MSDRIQATYLIETAHPLQQAADRMAGEQSTGTFVKVPGETAELSERYGARVERVTELGEVEVPSLPGSRPPKSFDGYKRAEVVLSFSLETVGTSLTGLWTAVAGNLFELSPFSGLKLTGLSLPDEFLGAQPGPQFGIAGTRRLAGVEGHPLIGTIVKPSVGLTPAETAALVAELCAAGLDFVKDDELQSDSPHSPFEARVTAVLRAVNDYADKTGKRVMVAFNLTGDIDTMLRRHDFVLAHGGTCVMVNLFAVGLAGGEAPARARRTAYSRPPGRLGDAVAPSAARDGLPRGGCFLSPRGGPTIFTSTGCATSFVKRTPRSSRRLRVASRR